MTRYGMVIDTKKCIGCHVCAMACKTENNLPNDVWWNRILTDNGGEMGFDMVGGSYPDDLQFGYVPVACQHCENPACVKVCPVGATYKDPETGVVRQDYDKCIGCRMCMSACPYNGVRSFNWEEPAFHMTTPWEARTPPNTSAMSWRSARSATTVPLRALSRRACICVWAAPVSGAIWMTRRLR